MLGLPPATPPQTPARNKWGMMSLPLKAAYLLGWRNVSFSASVTVLNGTVSSIWYDIEPDVFSGIPVSYFVVVRSVHGFTRNAGHRPVPVQSTDDESPQYRFGAVAGPLSIREGPDTAIGTAYAFDAPPDLISHAFQVDLRCFWGLRGCDSVRQVVPLLWNDRQAILNETAARLNSSHPCPDRILAGRVRYLLDGSVALLEVVRSREEQMSYEGDHSAEFITDYRLTQVIRGQPEGPWIGMQRRPTIPWPLSRTGERVNPMQPFLPKPGERFLYFGGATFDSCRIVPATPSAEAAVRDAVPAPRRVEDDIGWMWGRR